mmetsp:Transcript_61874/g.199529  ORF Transcript_61874/g.199529 Transcript_61874/m.199529 type:complete len:183 (+) Transcript_61874:115-663(+)
MEPETLSAMFETVFEAGSKKIQDMGAKPVVFSCIDSTGHFGPTRGMPLSDPLSRVIGQNKLRAAFDAQLPSRFVPGGMVPAALSGRTVVPLLSPAIHVVLQALSSWCGMTFAQSLELSNRYRLFYLGFPGALPVFERAEGRLVAAFAASGATGEQDEQAVEAGLQAAGLQRREDGLGYLWAR